MKKYFSLVLVCLLVFLLGVAPVSQSHQVAIAAATTKSFSSNYTLVNLGGDTAAVTASYVAPDGSEWGILFISLSPSRLVQTKLSANTMILA